MCNHLQTFPNLGENLYLMYVMSFLNLEVLKTKLTKSMGIMPYLKISRTYGFGTKKLKNKINCNSYGLMKIYYHLKP